jgi:oxalate decarboxylase
VLPAKDGGGGKGIVMTKPSNPADGAAQPSVDDRTVPSPNPPGSDTPPPQPVPEGPGIGAAAWPSEQTTPVGRGEQTAGGTDPDHPHLFHLADWGGNVFPGGSLQGANSENWPILVGQKGAVYLARLAVGGIREPHWHPSAWEVNVILAGLSRWVFVGPNGTQDVFEAGKGDVIFAPQGHYHYFENASATEELVALIVFNSDAAEPKDDIGIGQSLTAIPNDVLSAVLGVPVSIFEQIPSVPGRIVIVKRPEGQTGARRSGS